MLAAQWSSGGGIHCSPSCAVVVVWRAAGECAVCVVDATRPTTCHDNTPSFGVCASLRSRTLLYRRGNRPACVHSPHTVVCACVAPHCDHHRHGAACELVPDLACVGTVVYHAASSVVLAVPPRRHSLARRTHMRPIGRGARKHLAARDVTAARRILSRPVQLSKVGAHGACHLGGTSGWRGAQCLPRGTCLRPQACKHWCAGCVVSCRSVGTRGLAWGGRRRSAATARPLQRAMS